MTGLYQDLQRIQTIPCIIQEEMKQIQTRKHLYLTIEKNFERNHETRITLNQKQALGLEAKYSIICT